jgi:hypothetical protein
MPANFFLQGHALAELEQWTEARKTFETVSKLPVPVNVNRELALLSLKLGNTKQYGDLCTNASPNMPVGGFGGGMMGMSGLPPAAWMLQTAPRTALVAPGGFKVDPKTDMQMLFGMMGGGMMGMGGMMGGGMMGIGGGMPMGGPAGLNTAAAAWLRLSEPKKALEILDPQIELQEKPAPWDLVFLALAQHETGKTKEAEQTLDRAKKRFQEVAAWRQTLPAAFRRPTWQERLEDELLLADAVSRLRKKE